MKKNVKIIALIILLLIVNACKKTTGKVSNVNAYSEYVSVFPEKLVSITPKFDFFLKKKIEEATVNNDVFTISPKVKGEVTFKNNVISFIPNEKLQSNQEYKLTLHLSKLYDEIDSDLKDFTIKVKTKELLFNVSLKSPKVSSKDIYVVEGVLTASDVIESSKLPTLIKANYNGKQTEVKFETFEKFASKIHFKIDSLQRFDDDKVLKIEWDGTSIKSTSKGDRELIITGKNNFKVLNAEVVNTDKQHIEISFSDPIKKGQDLSGLIQFENTQKRRFTYKISNNVVNIYPKSSFKNKVVINVFKGIKNSEGYDLKEKFSKTLHFEQLKPSVSFIKSGSILPNSNNLKINFKSVNLKAVDATVYKIYKNNVLQFLQHNNLNNQGNLRYVGRPEAKYTVNLTNQGVDLTKENAFAIDLTEVLAIENGAMYRVELSFNKEYSNYSCDGIVNSSTIVYGKKKINTKQYDSQNYYNNDYYNYNWRDRENPCTSSYYYSKKISTNILATNLGVIVKKGNNNKTFIAVTNLLTAESASGAKVTLFNLQQQAVTTLTTDKEGIAKFDEITNAFFAVVTKNNNTTYVKLNEGSALSMSKFDVSGTKLQKGIKGYIYGERGVWRPGDQLFLTFVLNDKANPLPEKHPIKFELINPQGKIVDRKIQYKNAHNVYAYAPKTNVDAITGNWKLRVSVGGAVFTKTLKIETIKPNRLKIKLNTATEVIKANTSIDGDVEVKWLHGAIARNLKLDINGKFRQTKTEFSKFKNYNFDDVTRRFGTEEFSVLKGKLNNEGETKFSVKPKLDTKAPGMLKASFITKVYENGGDFSTDVFTKKVSPYTSYVGLLNAEEQQSKNYLFTDEKYTFNVATVNENGVGVANRLDVKVYKLSWRWWWSTSDNGLSNYDGTRYHEPYKTVQVKTGANGKGSFDLKVSENDWGRYLIKITDKKSKHVTSNIAYFDWPSWYGKKKGSQDKTNATMLVFTTDKETYNVKETATVKFPSSEGGRALITIENGTEVLDHFWVPTKAKQTKFSFPVLANYTPNVYVNISLLQKHSQTVNDLPIRMYGSLPMLVNDPATKLEPEIQLADELRPESVANIRVKEKNGKPMTYTIALVDDGLLDLTRFKTPNPWNTFYARQSLGVRTWDIFDDVIGAYGGKVNQILSIGGDEAEAGSKNKKANRFKPMVTYLGPFNLEKGDIQKHSIKIPKYVGSVRAMVVATNAKEEAYGSDEKTAFVRKPVMILASLPRKITPQETVTLPVTVFAMKPEIKKVKVTVAPNESYTIVGDKTQTISFNQPDEKMAYFTLKVNDFKGIGKVKINASSGNEKASYEVEIDVLNPNPVTTEVKDLVLKSNEVKEIDFTAFGTKGTNTASVELSTLPPMNFTKRMGYLIRYPHGCVEQTTSSAFPQLYLPEIFDLSKEKQQSIERNIKATIQRLSDFQISNGGLSYWQGNSSADNWGTSYAGHFMIEAAKKGYVLPIGFKSNWIAYQKQQARNWRNNSSYYNNAFNQAYRLYTLSLANSPDLASMNRLRETKNISNQAKMRLAAAYALIGKKSIANIILGTLTEENYARRYYYNYGSETRNKAMALETYTLLKDEVKAIKLAKEIAGNLSSDKWMSTQTTAFSLLAMSQYALQNGDNTGIHASYTLNSNSKKINIQKALYAEDIEEIKKENTFKISNKSKGVLYVRLLNKGILPVGVEKIVQKNLETTITYKTKGGNRIDPISISQGTNFIAEVTVRNSTNDKVENIALTEYIPSGWEIINTRFTDFGNNTTSSKVDYTDIRDASISNYFTLNKYEIKTFRVLLNASYLGKYYLPGVQVEAMYDNDYIARTKGQWIEVVK
ncbi:MG2 domain-containing protein [uncultured Tenacibaculum sp.]|uniref:alpha-2-macroglobulin family protein n=1 Tax=uncultured Tenacibaculum sp. TaxID=174713 RepID=UPI00261A79D2|nr:MG2 domain-containing protein [uncultured Tenacibaculum sp.]